MQLTDIHPCTLYTGISKEKLIESVYLIIKNDYGGKATAKRLEDKMDDDINKRKMRYAIKHLTKEGKINELEALAQEEYNIIMKLYN